MTHVPHPFHAPFPIDIEEYIIDQLVDHAASLRNCSLTCRAWLPRSHFHLFRAIRIATRATWDAALDYFRDSPHMRPLVRSLAMAPATPAERIRLLGTYPAALFQMLPNLRRWEIRAPALDATTRPDAPKVSFHRTTLIQLRYSPITELHLSSIRFTSRAEFVSLVSSIPLLRGLQCTDVHFGSTSEILFRRRPSRLPRLSTLQASDSSVCHWQEDDDLLPWLLDVSQSSLQSLVLWHQKNVVVKWQPASDKPFLSKLVSLTLHVDQHPHHGIDTLYLETVKDALSCMQTLRCGSTLERLEIHLHLRNPSLGNHLQPKGSRAPCKDPVSLALFLSGDRMRHCCQALEQVLLADRATHLTVVTHLPSHWTNREIVLRTLREDAFPNLHSKGFLNVRYSGGDSCQSCRPSHDGPVSTLVASPDGRWIASASSNLAMLWDARDRRPIREWMNPIEDPSTMSIVFSPDSMRLACCGHIKGRRPFVSILPTDEGSRLAVLEGRELDEDDPVSQLVCSWLPDRLIFVCRTRSAVSVCIWGAHTLELRFSWEDTTPVDCDSVLLSRDGQRLAVAAICDPWEASVRSYQGPRATNVPLCVLWDLTTGGSREVLIARSSQDQVLAATFDPEGERLVLSFADHTIRIWDVETRETLLSVSEPVPVKFEPHYHLYTSLSSEIPSSKAVTFSPDGRYLLSLRYMSIDDHRETLVILWDSRSGRPLLRLEDTQPSARGYGNAGLVLFNPSGTYIAFTANDGMVQVFDLYRGLPVRTHWRPENVSTQFGQCPSYSASRDGPASSLAISSNGQTLCWGTWRGEVEIHSLD